MQIKAISLFIASYLVISTVAAPTTPIHEEVATANDAAQKAGLTDLNGVIIKPLGDPLNLPITEGLAKQLRHLDDAGNTVVSATGQ
jgi:hypothetical protein